MDWFVGLLCVTALCWFISEIFAPRVEKVPNTSKSTPIAASAFSMNAWISEKATSPDCRYVIYRCGDNGRNCGATKGYGAIRAPKFCKHGAIAEDDWGAQKRIDARYNKETDQ